MPLTVVVTERKLPSSEGWYWLKRPGGSWVPVFVNAGGGGWPCGINTPGGHFKAVDEVDGEWGPQIASPDQPCWACLVERGEEPCSGVRNYCDRHAAAYQEQISAVVKATA